MADSKARKLKASGVLSFHAPGEKKGEKVLVQVLPWGVALGPKSIPRPEGFSYSGGSFELDFGALSEDAQKTLDRAQKAKHQAFGGGSHGLEIVEAETK